MVDYAAIAGFGEGVRKVLEPYIDAQFVKNQERDKSIKLVDKLLRMSELPEGFDDDDARGALSREIADVVDSGTLQNVLNLAASGEGQLNINLKGEGNQLRDSNIYWKIPSLDLNRTQNDRKRGAWIGYHESVNKLMSDGGISLEDASTNIIRDMLKNNPKQVASLHEYVNGTTAKTYEARQMIGQRMGLLNVSEDPYTREKNYILPSDIKDQLSNLGLLDTVEKQKLDPYSIKGKVGLMQIILYDRNSPAYQAFNVYTYRALTAGSEATIQAIDQSVRVADNNAKAFGQAVDGILKEDEVPASSGDIPRDIMTKMQKDNIINPVVLRKQIENAGIEPTILLKGIVATYVPDASQNELRELIYKYLYSIAEGD